jgi:hypothetical protein
MKGTEKFGALCAGILLGAPVLVWRAYAATMLWGWYVVPAFRTPAIDVIQAIGLHLLILLMRSEAKKSDDDGVFDVSFVVERVLVSSGFIAVTLGAGYVGTFWLRVGQ